MEVWKYEKCCGNMSRRLNDINDITLNIKNISFYVNNFLSKWSKKTESVSRTSICNFINFRTSSGQEIYLPGRNFILFFQIIMVLYFLNYHDAPRLFLINIFSSPGALWISASLLNGPP